MSGLNRFTQFRAWQACVTYKKAVYAICEVPPLATDFKKRRQLEGSVAGPPAHIAEGYGRFNPPDFGNFVVFRRASLMESQSHLMDLVDAKYITDAKRQELDALAQEALREVTGPLEYLQSPEALRNASNNERRTTNREPNLNTNGELRTQKSE